MTQQTGTLEEDYTKDYIGDELELFKHATNWKAYFARKLKPYITGDVAEIGAGLGGTTILLSTGSEASWTSVEPDPELCRQLRKRAASGEVPPVSVVNSTLDGFSDDQKFDAILYIDVLEHIEDDKGEVEKAIARLRPGGKLIVLSPAYNFLYSPFDKAIGHYRRYTRSALADLTPTEAKLEKSYYLDSVGLLASTANKVLLKQSMPKPSQIRFWDKVLVPMSRLLDPLMFGAVGKTVIAVWTRNK